MIGPFCPTAGDPGRSREIQGDPGKDDASQTLSLPEIPPIALLPFENLSSNPEQDYFSDSIVEDVITALSQFSGD
jgi:TolB-like protein